MREGERGEVMSGKILKVAIVKAGEVIAIDLPTRTMRLLM